MRKVLWPSRTELVTYSIVVIVFVVIMVAIVAGLDFGFAKLVLSVFGVDVAIPGPVLVCYWNATGGWSEFQTRQCCQRLVELALVSDYRHDSDQLMLHRILHAYLGEQTRHRRGELNRALIDAHRSLVPEEDGASAWWQLVKSERK